MNEFYSFASNSPFLTFFLASMILSAIVKIFQAIFGYNKTPKKVEELK